MDKTHTTNQLTIKQNLTKQLATEQRDNNMNTVHMKALNGCLILSQCGDKHRYFSAINLRNGEWLMNHWQMYKSNTNQTSCHYLKLDCFYNKINYKQLSCTSPWTSQLLLVIVFWFGLDFIKWIIDGIHEVSLRLTYWIKYRVKEYGSYQDICLDLM